MIYGRLITGLSFLIILGAILFKPFPTSFLYNTFISFYSNISLGPSEIDLFTSEELQRYNGVDRSELYLSILGIVFDVTEGQKHYGVDGHYRFFIGKDGSRSFVNGNFYDNSPNKDHVLDFNCDELLVLTKWVDTYKNRYKYKGKLIGRYYNNNGKMTEYMNTLNNKIKHCEKEKEHEIKELKKFPPCNIAWDAQTGSRVWCTNNSGGVARDWVGVPRQLYTPGSSSPKCVCIDPRRSNPDGTFKEYKGCSQSATSCQVTDDN